MIDRNLSAVVMHTVVCMLVSALGPCHDGYMGSESGEDLGRREQGDTKEVKTIVIDPI